MGRFIPTTLIPLFKTVFPILKKNGFAFLYNFRLIFLLSVPLKNIAEIFIGIVLNWFLFVDKWHFYYVESYNLWNQYPSPFLFRSLSHCCVTVFSIKSCIYFIRFILEYLFCERKEMEKGRKREREGGRAGGREQVKEESDYKWHFLILTIIWLLLEYWFFLYIFLASLNLVELLRFWKVFIVCLFVCITWDFLQKQSHHQQTGTIFISSISILCLFHLLVLHYFIGWNF